MKNIFLALIGTSFLFNSCVSEDQHTINTDSKTAKDFHSGPQINIEVKHIPNQQVCMVNNRFMGKDQIPVLANQKTYYGCCEGCVEALKKDETHHFDVDPITGQQVDKATAFILLKPESTDEVVYFHSKKTAKAYSERKAKNKRYAKT